MTSPVITERPNLLLPNHKRWPLDPSKPAIELKDVYLSFDDNHVLKGLNLNILPGKATVIVGRSGSGKSVLLKLMMGLLQPTKGTVTVFGRDLSTLSPTELLETRKRMGLMFQNYALFDALSVEDNVGFTLIKNSTIARDKILKMSHELIDTMGLAGSERLLPSELSGGMRKRVSLSRALIFNPEVVLFDEPTTGLDPIMIEKVDQMILLAKKQFQITSAIISHDMASAKRLADKIAFLHDGKIVFYGSHDEFLKDTHPAVKTFVEGSRTSRLSKSQEIIAVDDDVTKETHLEKAEKPIVDIIDLHKKFGEKHVLKGVNLKIYPGKITVLIGGSGSGKSVIIKHIMGLFKPTSGKIVVFDKDIVPMDEMQMNEVRGRFGLLFQHAALLDWLSVRGNIEFPLKERTDTPKSEIKTQVEELMERLKIADLHDRMPGEISEGQKKRVGLARALIMRPEIMIYDEPTTGQDPIRTREVDDMIQETQEQFNITSIVISHDMASTFRIAHNIALLNQGQIAAYGTPSQVRNSPDAHVQEFIHAGSVDH